MKGCLRFSRRPDGARWLGHRGGEELGDLMVDYRREAGEDFLDPSLTVWIETALAKL